MQQTPKDETAGSYSKVSRRLLALDIGDVRTGVATSDATNSLASPAAVLTARTKETLLAELNEYIEDFITRIVKELTLANVVALASSRKTVEAKESYHSEDLSDDELIVKRTSDRSHLEAPDLFECLVVGLPLDQHGNETERAAKVREWGEYVASGIGLRTAFVDERYTTRLMISADRASKRRAKDGKANIDARAAAEILQSFMDAKKALEALENAEISKKTGAVDG